MGDSNANLIEVVPEMLDYEFVANCESTDELRAVLNSLESGEHGKYPDLECAVKTKMGKLREQRKSRLAAADGDDEIFERDSLEEWLGSLAGVPNENSARGRSEGNQGPVRSVSHFKFGDNEISFADSKEETHVFRKEKLSTKEYYGGWDKFDVDAALAEVETEQSQVPPGKVDLERT